MSTDSYDHSDPEQETLEGRKTVSQEDLAGIDHYSVGSSKTRVKLPAISSLRAKLIVPYGLLTIATAVLGLFVVSRLVASTFRERFQNQLIDSSRVAADEIVRLERDHLESLRQMAFTQGVPEAALAGDADSLEVLLFPQVLNENIHTLGVIDWTGREIVSWVYDFYQQAYVFTEGTDLASYSFVERTLAGEVDEEGDKFTEIVNTADGVYLFTSAPLQNADEEIIGALLLGTQVDQLLGEIKQQSLADVILLDGEGSYLAATLPPPDEGVEFFSLVPGEITMMDPALNKITRLYNREYEIYYSPLNIREEEAAIMGTVLPTNFVVSAEATSGEALSLIFAFGVVGIVVIGYMISQNIAKPILHLRDVSLAVSSGDLEQRTGIERKDEIGDLADVFDEMTGNLYERTIEVARLYSESVERSEELATINARLHEAQQQLMRSEKLSAVGQLAAGIVHDVKNPLANIRGLAQELRDDLPAGDASLPMLEMVIDNATRANEIVTDLLKFARYNESKPKLGDLNASIISSYRLTEYLARKNKVEVNTELAEEGVMTVYDDGLIEQVLINLIQNAIQAMPEGGTLTLRSSMNGEWAKIEVEDEGVGIKAENVNRIFDPFFTTKPASEGTGLGLSVSYGIISQHGGGIEVDSKVGVGTKFTIRLPQISDD